ncbi:MAG: hypothetical protein EZS28_038002 [Streblomastix strix]|uniref:Uncharacterized protein n=1 Tax=Streblomastix strix TaxID=222440 RepID=A0A5J4U9A9_9EUKA|nr:MAG: hypothetical protein EZS28_038002 [Streblomastix strix]
MDALLLLKADKTDIIDVLFKIEKDAFHLLKANVADLTNYVDLTSAQTITGQQLFDVATKKSKVYIFDTQSDLNTWKVDQDNVAKLTTETEPSDMINAIATLGAATGSDNVIPDVCSKPFISTMHSA